MFYFFFQHEERSFETTAEKKRNAEKRRKRKKKSFYEEIAEMKKKIKDESREKMSVGERRTFKLTERDKKINNDRINDAYFFAGFFLLVSFFLPPFFDCYCVFRFA